MDQRYVLIVSLGNMLQNAVFVKFAITTLSQILLLLSVWHVKQVKFQGLEKLYARRVARDNISTHGF
jgi:hypothetical protein